MVLIVFQVELFFQATVKLGGEGFPGMLASFTKAICESLIWKTCLLEISDELCHELMAVGLIFLLILDRCVPCFPLCMMFGYSVGVFYEGKSWYSAQKLMNK